MSGVRAGRVVKLKNGRREKARPVLRMMAIMQEGNNEKLPKEFVEGGRTGRRNAMPDILNAPDVHASTADLPSRLQQLATDVSIPDVRRQDPIPHRFYDVKNPDVMFAAVSTDPNNPQPGPSTPADTSAEPAKTDAEKKDAS